MLFGFVAVVSMADNSEHTIPLCPESGQTPLTTPIKIRWTGYLRGRIAERHGQYVQGDDNPSNTERARSFMRTLRRQKTNIVIETVEEAEYFIKEMERYAIVDIHWMNGPMRNAAQRVLNEARTEFRRRGHTND